MDTFMHLAALLASTVGPFAFGAFLHGVGHRRTNRG